MLLISYRMQYNTITNIIHNVNNIFFILYIHIIINRSLCIIIYIPYFRLYIRYMTYIVYNITYFMLDNITCIIVMYYVII